MFIFTLQLAVSKIQGRYKSEMHQMTLNWTWTLNTPSSQENPVYTKYLYPSVPNFGPFHCTTRGFEDIARCN